MTWTPDQVIEIYLATREEEREDKKAFEARSAVRQGKMELAENFLLGTMIERGEEQIKTKVGTAYKSPQMRCTMVDRQAVINFVVENLVDLLEDNPSREELTNKAPAAFALFTNHLDKNEVKRLLDTGVAPPGVDVHTFVQCNIRKA
jgi:hypothetical protein